ncbi:MAG: ROK family protein [Clostridia bacterium]|nr:ROK family protein [Clostridia bacterium]
MNEIKINPKYIPSLDKNFKPAVLVNRAFEAAVEKSGKKEPLIIALERDNNFVSTYKTMVFSEDSQTNYDYVERLVKSFLWMRGGWKLTIAGPKSIGEYIRNAYSAGGIREFDAKFMERIYEREFIVEITDIENTPSEKQASKASGRHLNGCRIGLDLGGSDRKVCAVADGNVLFSEEVIWHPKTQSDPEYHYNEIIKALKTAAGYMPRVDAVGVSSAGVYVNNRVMAASLFIKVPDDLFDKKVKDIIINAVKQIGEIPVEVANDGDVTALAGAMELNDTNVLGIAMGTSEAGGYVDADGNITGWLNEFAFVPVDYNKKAMLDEWSGDYGCGVKYFSQDAVIKLSDAAGIEIDSKLTPAEKLKLVQELHEKGDERASMVFESIGCYLGYSVAHYADFYDIKHILILGRVTSGQGGNIIINTANKVLKEEFPELFEKIRLHLPDEANRRVGQAIAAASLPKI